MSLTVYYPSLDGPARQSRLDRVLSRALAGREVQMIRRAEDLDRRRYPRILFALPLDEAGQNFEYFRMLARLRRETNLLEGCTGGLIVDGPGELYTKSTAAELALAMNQAGCALVGRPLVEATGSLANFRIQAKNLGADLAGAYEAAARELAGQAETFVFPARERPNLLALHASSHHTSNTMALWGELQKRLSPRWQVEEIGLRNGTLSDCSGCPYTMCLHLPPHRPVPADPVLRQGGVRPGGVRLLGQRHRGPAADLRPEHEQVLLPPAPVRPAGDRQRPRRGPLRPRHPGPPGPVRRRDGGSVCREQKLTEIGAP